MLHYHWPAPLIKMRLLSVVRVVDSTEITQARVIGFAYPNSTQASILVCLSLTRKANVTKSSIYKGLLVMSRKIQANHLLQRSYDVSGVVLLDKEGNPVAPRVIYPIEFGTYLPKTPLIMKVLFLVRY